mmetsp:Transcript_65043/g.190281  ORF Transcript_65043/g.190281 Transcript_65043/m.190281 type:complete len:353 (+) Transcript_65043:64-1122(+)
MARTMSETRHPSTQLQWNVQLKLIGEVNAPAEVQARTLMKVDAKKMLPPPTPYSAELVGSDFRSPNAAQDMQDHSHSVPFHKTKMCKFFVMGGCQRGTYCSYAHSDRELSSRPDLYRTELCHRFKNSGRCRNGDACSFAHSRQQLRKSGMEEGVQSGTRQTFHLKGVSRRRHSAIDFKMQYAVQALASNTTQVKGEAALTIPEDVEHHSSEESRSLTASFGFSDDEFAQVPDRWSRQTTEVTLPEGHGQLSPKQANVMESTIMTKDALAKALATGREMKGKDPVKALECTTSSDRLVASPRPFKTRSSESDVLVVKNTFLQVETIHLIPAGLHRAASAPALLSLQWVENNAA